MQLVQFAKDVQLSHVSGQSLHVFDKLNILSGHGSMQMLPNKIPLKQLKHVFVVLMQVLHGAVQ
jgi:hypothetical protein